MAAIHGRTDSRRADDHDLEPDNRLDGGRGSRVEVIYYAHPSVTGTTIPDLIDTLKSTEKYAAPTLRVSSLTTTPARVGGARAAKLITERGSNSNGPHFGQVLLVQTRSGPLIQLSATRFAGAGGFDPTQVINSLRLILSV